MTKIILIFTCLSLIFSINAYSEKLSEQEYKHLLNTSSKFKEADKKLNESWKLVNEFVIGDEKNKLLIEQKKWLKEGRDLEAQTYIEKGLNKEDAYIEAINQRRSQLQLIVIRMNQSDVVKDIEDIDKNFENKTNTNKITNFQLFLNKKSDDFCNDIKLRSTDSSFDIEIPTLIDGISQVYIDNKEIKDVAIQKFDFSNPESGGILHIKTQHYPSSIKITGEGELECIWSKRNSNNNSSGNRAVYNNDFCKQCFVSTGFKTKWNAIGVVCNFVFPESTKVFINGIHIKNKNELSDNERREYYKYDFYDLSGHGALRKMMTIIPYRTKIDNVRNIIFEIDGNTCIIPRREFR